MQRPKHLNFLSFFLLLLTILPLIHARQPPTSFCKCICFQNSTIIPLNSPPPSSSSSTSTNSLLQLLHHRTEKDKLLSSSSISEERQEQNSGSGSGSSHRQLTCNDCNRAFCLDYNLAICKNAKEEDVFTSCFQRDSLKDLFVIVLFLLLTSSLLIWAVVRPYVLGVWNGGNSKGDVVGRLPFNSLDGNMGMGMNRGGGGGGMGGRSGRYDDVDGEDDDNHDETARIGGGGGNSRLLRQGGLNS